MAITGKFLADFTAFYAAVQKADVELKGLETGAGRVETSLNRMADSFSGRKLIQDATLAAEAVERIGGATKLTEAEQAKLNALLTEGLAKYKALGLEAPKSMTDLATATAKVPKELQEATKATTGLGISFTSLFGAFSLANIASNLVSKLTTEIGVFVTKGTQLAGIERSFETLARSIQQDSGEMLQALQTATRGMVSEFDLMQSANKAVLLGLPVTKESLGELATAATALGKAMGQDATKSLDDLITALGRSSPLILDNLGLTVKVGEANEAYAEKLGKSADALTESEKKMAFYEAAMEAARKKTAELGEQSKTLGEILSTVWTKVGDQVSSAVSDINIGLGRLLSSFKNLESAMRGGGGGNFILSPFIISAAAADQKAADLDRTLRNSIISKPPVGWGKIDGLNITVQSMDDLSDELKIVTDENKKFEDGLKKTGKALDDALVTAARRAVTAFKDFHKQLDDVNFAMQILVAQRLNDFGKTAQKVLHDSTDATIVWVRAMHGLIPVVDGLGKGVKIIGEEVDIAFSPAKMSTLDAFAAKLSQTILAAFQGGGNVGESIGGFLGGSLFSDTGLAKTITTWATKLSGTLGNVLGAILPGLGNLVGGLLGGLVDKIFGPTDYEKRVRAAAKAISDLKAQLLSTAGSANALRVAFDKFGGGISFDEFFKITDADAFKRISDQFLKDLPKGLNDLVASAVKTGEAIPAALEPMIEELIRAGGLTEGVTNLLLGLPEAGVPAFDEVRGAAERLGLPLDAIGQSIKQMQFTDLAASVARDLDILARAGADMDAVLNGTQDRLQELVLDALKFGFSLPESIKPFLQKLVDAGKLTDLFGDKLEDLDDLHFTKPLEKSVEDLILAMQELVKVIKDDVGGALDDLGRKVVRPRVEVDTGSLSQGGGSGTGETLVRQPIDLNLDGKAVGRALLEMDVTGLVRDRRVGR